MKKIIILFASIVGVLFCLSACAPQHEHVWGEYQYDENGHWRDYTCGHIAQSNTEKHRDGDANEECDICGYAIKKPTVASIGIEYVLNNDGTKYAVKSIGTCTDKELVIPDTYEGLPVVGVLSGAFAGNTEIKSIVLPDSVMIIYENAFAECTSLEHVAIGNGLKSIWECAFLGCESLAEIHLPNGLEYIYGHAFNGCISLKEIAIPDSVTHVAEYAFANCAALQSISFSDSMTLIEMYTCYGCSSLKSIEFGASVTSVRKDAFYGCAALERLYIPKNITRLQEAFSGCTSLNHVEFEETSNWKWASKTGFFNSADVKNSETNAEKMTGRYDGSSWMRETE